MRNNPEDWYVAEGSAGFTRGVEGAKRNKEGHPYACNGYVTQVWKAHYAQDKARRDAIWEKLLDNMEEEVDIAEENEEAKVVAWRTAGNVLRSTLAILHYGVDSEPALAAIGRMAERKYNE